MFLSGASGGVYALITGVLTGAFSNIFARLHDGDDDEGLFLSQNTMVLTTVAEPNVFDVCLQIGEYFILNYVLPNSFLRTFGDTHNEPPRDELPLVGLKSLVFDFLTRAISN